MFLTYSLNLLRRYGGPLNYPLISLHSSFHLNSPNLENLGRMGGPLLTKPSAVIVAGEAIDNFEELFNSLTTKICFGISMATEYLISDVWGVLYILFDKYGEDSMKRSLFNQVNSQFSYPMILSSIISTNGWAWRIYIGPLNRFVADIGKKNY